jgi:3-methyladenine DNA glycosylase AlkC
MPQRPATTRTVGATRRSDVPADVRAALNAGRVESRTLAETLIIDFRALLRAVAPDAPPALVRTIDPEAGIIARMQQASAAMQRAHGEAAAGMAMTHVSDTVRGWAAFILAARADVPLAERLAEVRPLADDANSGVREWAWLAMRPHIAVSLPEAFALLTAWTADPSPRIRRFASEATRPCGVWCAHITSLKGDPSPGLAVLEPLRSDPERYVQLSVANWLNDASKTAAPWVRDVTSRWLRESPTTETRWIVHHATRTLRKLAT